VLCRICRALSLCHFDDGFTRASQAETVAQPTKHADAFVDDMENA